MSNTESPKKAAILAIGTEVTTGEINNTNAAVIAARLSELGFSCDLHIAVPDERNLMNWAIKSAISERDLVIITGGLGPTSDDFTREVIASVAGSKLIWNESSWQVIIKRLDSVSAPHAESNKQQAFFPEGATIYQNNHGTASAFSISCGNALIVALPGPPKEIEGIWNDHLHAIISSMAPRERNQIPRRWRCLGVSESKLGELVEESLKGSGFLTGYRSHLPYIDIKIWVPENRSEEFKNNWQPKLEAKIENWIVGRDDDDAADILRKLCETSKPFYINDLATNGYLAQRVFGATKNPQRQISILTSHDSNISTPLKSESLFAEISANIETGQWQLKLTANEIKKIFSEKSRYSGQANAERLRAYLGEKTLLTIIDWMRSLPK
jgi:molybdenum cofactor synthesis domain-containing protein